MGIEVVANIFRRRIINIGMLAGIPLDLKTLELQQEPGETLRFRLLASGWVQVVLTLG